MIPILDWIFEGIVGWVSSIASQLLDAVSGLFLEALGTDMTAMEEYFPFVTKAYGVMQVTAYAILILIVLWQLFRAFGGPITEAENPWHLVVRGAIFGFLIGYAKPIFSACLTIARAPYTSLMDLSMTGEDFTFAGVEQALTNGLTTLVATASVVGLILILILLIALGWNYFKLLLETVERYIVVGVLCYTSPLAFSMGASKSTNNVFKSWCRMVGSQLLLLVMNVWFLRGFASSMGQFIGNGGALTTGKGSIFLWMFCALAYLKCAQRFDSYLASMGLNVAQTGSSMGMELLMAARVISGVGSGARSAGSVFGKEGSGVAGSGAGTAAGGLAGFASRFSPNSYVRDAVVEGGTRMGFSGGAGFVGRAFGGIAVRNGATLNGQSISSVASRAPGASGTIAGDIADRSLSNYMPHMQGFQMKGTQITDLAIESAKSLIACRNPSNVKELSVDGLTGFLTLTPEGSPKCPYLYVQAFRKMKNRYTKRFGAQIVLTPHILRHTFATRASEAELTIKSLVYAMGHTTAQMSLDRYADNSSEHTSKEMQQKFSSGLTAVS